MVRPTADVDVLSWDVYGSSGQIIRQHFSQIFTGRLFG
jgi:hypothetical protein